MKKIWLLFYFLTGGGFCMVNSLFAIINYSMVPSSTVYTPLSGGVNIPDLSAGSDLTVTAPLPIGFNFIFDGTTYTQFQMSDNGYIHLGNNLGSTGYGNASGDEIIPNDFTDATGSTPGINTMRPFIAPLWEELAIANIGGSAKYLLAGTMPTRTLTIEWNKVSWRAPTGTDQVSFQVVLYEGSNIIDFIYRADAVALGPLPTASIGLAGISNGDYYSLSNSGTSPVVSKTVNTMSIAAKPATGQRYRWTNLATLPVQLLSFTGVNWSGGNLLEWKTASETGNDYFTLERSANANQFEALETIKGAGTSSSAMSYQYLDSELPASDDLLYYRLKQTDLDHAVTYSPIIALGLPAKQPTIYFDEATLELSISCCFHEEGLYEIDICDMTGRSVYKDHADIKSRGSTVLSIAWPFVEKGIYILKITSPSGIALPSSKLTR